MSLKRQLMWLGVGIIVALLVGVSFIVAHNLKAWVERDSAQRALDTASALAQAVAPGLSAGDRRLVASYIDGILDENSYDELRISGPSLETDVVREGKREGQSVPSWFANLVALSPATAEVRLAGDNGRDHTITLKPTLSDVYKRMWSTALQLFALFVLGLIIWLFFQSMYLKRFLHPLTLVAEQLRRIYRQQFTPTHIINRYAELIPLVEATEDATTSTRGEIQSLNEQLTDAQSRLQVDSLTGLGNRTALDIELGQEGGDEPASSHNAVLSEKGTIIIIELDDLREINIKHGVEAADKMLAEVAELIRAKVNTIAFGRVWRTGGGTFMCRTDLTAVVDAKKWCDDLIVSVNHYAGQSSWIRPDLVAIGAVIYQSGDLMSDILSVADDAVQRARQKSEQRYVVLDMPTLSEAHIRLTRDRATVLKDQLTVESLDLMYRPAISVTAEEKLHYEIAPWLPGDDGATLSTTDLMFHTQRAGLDAQLLSASLSLAGEVSLLNPGLALSLKVGAGPLFDAEIDHWLGIFRDNLKIADGFALQVSETSFSHPMIEALALLRESLNAEGMRFGVDSVGRGGSGHAWLQTVKPDFIVIDPSFGRDLTDTYGSLFYVTSISEICKGLDIDVLIDGIDARRDWQQLRDTGVRGALGDYSGRARAGAPE